jgi:hypothetical protein
VDLSSRYREYIECLNRRDLATLGLYVTEDVTYNSAVPHRAARKPIATAGRCSPFRLPSEFEVSWVGDQGQSGNLQ